jgi:hypothetical protein
MEPGNKKPLPSSAQTGISKYLPPSLVSIEEWITGELGIIAQALGVEVKSESQIRLMVEELKSETPEMLAMAFMEFRKTGERFPKPADFVKPIRNREFAADYAWLLRNLKEHGPTWKDSPERLGELKRIPGMGPDDFYPREILEPAIPAPAMPPRIAKAVEIYGHGNRESALRRLYRHPDCKGGTDADSLRAQRDLDLGFRAAWDLARGEA